MERTYLKNKILLLSESDGSKFKRTFTVTKRLGEGGSMAIAYEAYHDSSSGRGVLREFYPQDSIILKRRSDNQLVIEGDFEEAVNRYLDERNKYVNSYIRLADAVRNNANQNLSKYLPVFEVYYGCDQDMNPVGTAYIWTPEPKLSTFESVCQENHRHPKTSPEYKLVSSLKAIEALSEAVMELHMAGFIHRDIKPSNFGFQMSHSKVLTESFKIFDIDSICPAIQRRFSSSVYSEGFTEMEATSMRPSVQTDIYSIGASLFHAIIVNPEAAEGKYLYSDEYFERIEEFVNSSELITCSETNSHPRLRHMIIHILKKCLDVRARRYEKCEDLIKDLNTALYYALPGELLGSSSSSKWVLTDIKSALDKTSPKNSAMAIINHLYEFPFYLNIDKDSEYIDILVIGLGNYGQKFIDICLQAGQMFGKTIRIHSVTEDKLDSSIYLEERPELPNFFVIDGRGPKADSYGEIYFRQYEFAASSTALKKSVTDYILASNIKYSYVFVALGSESSSKAAAKGVWDAVKKAGYSTAVSYASEETSDFEERTINGICPLYVNAPLSIYKHSDDIERMAFNMHLLWEKNLNIDLKKIRKEYNEGYNHISSVCAVLSLKYKLYSVGYNLDESSFEEIADSYSINEFEDQLIYLEHRRWVTEKICDGWKRRTVDDSVNGVTRDKKLKNHICIVKSKPNQNLKKNFSSKGLKTWDVASGKDLEELDELDRLSLDLHRSYMKKAGGIDATTLLNGRQLSEIYSLIENKKDALMAFQEWFSCIREIITDSPDNACGKRKLYNGLKNNLLLVSSSVLDEDLYVILVKLIADFENSFSPVLLSREYRDYKAADTELIVNTPFILTYSTKTNLVIPFGFENVSLNFQNVAVPAVVNPEKIFYIADVTSLKDLANLRDAITGMLKFFMRKSIRPVVEFFITFDKTSGAILDRVFEKEMIALGDGIIKSIKRFPYSDKSKAIAEIKEYISKKNTHRNEFSLEKNSSTVSKMMMENNIYDGYSSYSFDSALMKFNDVNNCPFLKHINKLPILLVNEAMLLKQKSMSVEKPEFYNDYKDLWKEYTSLSSVWMEFSKLINEYSNANDVVAILTRSESKKTPEKYTYIIPHYCSKNAAKLIDYLKSKNIIGEEAMVRGFTSESSIVSIVDHGGLKKQYDRIFGNVYLLGINDALKLQYDDALKTVKIAVDELQVKALDISGNSKKLTKLLKYFEGRGYISCLEINSDKASFVFSTTSFKRFILSSNEIKRVYLYHSIKELSVADDIVSNCFIEGEKEAVDIIVTKGFKMFFIKLLESADDNDSKFKNIVKNYGINSDTIVIRGNDIKAIDDTIKRIKNW